MLQDAKDVAQPKHSLKNPLHYPSLEDYLAEEQIN